MKKNKLLTLAAAAIMATGAWAQTDVTSTYLTNADFSETTAITGTYLYGYGKDGSPYGYQAIDGWTAVVTAGDNSNASYPNSGTAAAVFSYGSDTQLKGNSKAAPVTNPAGEATGKCFGFFGVWGCGGYYYQNVTLSAGKYTITVPMYNQSGTQANTTYTGFFPTSGTNHTVAVNPTVGQWVNQTVTFTLADDTEGQIRIGYQSTGSGSGSNPMLFIDCVKIEFTAIVVKDVLETAITAAQSVNARLNSADLSTAITTAQAVYTDEDATQDEVNAAAATLNAAVGPAVADHINNGGDPTDVLANADLSSLDGWTVASSSQYNDKGNGLIGTYNVRFSAATVDETHLDTEYCLGFEARWSGNFASYSQTTVALPAGVYTLTYDVENVNAATSNLNYADYNFVQVGDTKYYSSATEWMAAKSSWTTHTIRVTLEEAAPITISFGYGTGSNNTPADNTPAIYVSHVKLNYSSFLDGAKAAWEEAKAAAETAKAENASVVGAELTALNAELDKAEPTTVDGYNTAIEALNAAATTLVAAAPAYNALVAEIAYAKSIDVNTARAEAAQNSEATAESIIAAAEALKTLEFTTINAAYANNVTSLLGTWDKGSYDVNPNDEGYKAGDSYFDKWTGSSANQSSSMTATLLAGKYAVMVAGRGVKGTSMSLSLTIGEEETVSTPFLMIDNRGFGIDVNGEANYSAEGEYACNGEGFGWQYRYLTFEVSEATNVTIAINGTTNNSWQSFYAPVLLCDDATYAPIAVDAAKAELQAAIDAAPAVVSFGDGAFKMPVAGVNAYIDAKTAAQDAHDAVDATLESLAAAKTDLASAIENYNALEINAPAEGQLFNVILTYAGWTYDNMAATYLAGDRDDMGGYNIKYQAANQNLAQAFTFTKVSGNNYKMSQIDAEGNVRYLSTGVPYDKGNAYQLRTTTDADAALVVTVIPTATEDVWNLFNTEANEYIGSQDAGFFTVNSHINFQIVETAKPSITINTTAAGWGTVMLPFAAELPGGVKAYSVAEIKAEEGDDTPDLVLVAVNALEANKPYIIEGAWQETLTGDAQGTALTVTEGLLTGVYETQDAPEGKYILQNQNDVVGFYQVDYAYLEKKELKKPQVKANRAYLTYEAPAGAEAVKAFMLGETTTAVNTVKVTAENAAVYNLAGQRVNKAQKGIYIVNGQKVVK